MRRISASYRLCYGLIGNYSFIHRGKSAMRLHVQKRTLSERKILNRESERERERMDSSFLSYLMQIH